LEREPSSSFGRCFSDVSETINEGAKHKAPSHFCFQFVFR
jgi:hypothetical protein